MHVAQINLSVSFEYLYFIDKKTGCLQFPAQRADHCNYMNTARTESGASKIDLTHLFMCEY